MQPDLPPAETMDQHAFFRWLHENAARPDPRRYELINSRVVMNPPAGWPHGSVEVRVAQVLSAFIDQHGLGIALGSSQGFELPTGDTVGPDFAYVSRERWAAAPPPQPGRFLKVVPDLVVEILSPESTESRDRGEKKEVYERSGIREYWLVDHRARAVLRYVRRADALDEGRLFSADEPFESHVLPGLSFGVRDLFPAP